MKTWQIGLGAVGIFALAWWLGWMLANKKINNQLAKAGVKLLANGNVIFAVTDETGAVHTTTLTPNISGSYSSATSVTQPPPAGTGGAGARVMQIAK